MPRAPLFAVALALIAAPSFTAAQQLIFAPLGTNLIPKELTRDDINGLTTAASKLYTAETVQVGAVERWSNPETGNSGTVTLNREFQHRGMPCREFTHRLNLGHQREQVYKVSRCRVESGEWKLLG